MLTIRPHLSNADLSLVSWLEAVGREQFILPFQQKTLDMKLEQMK